MAATTSGWHWPVETTAIPAKKSFPSTSVTMIPRPFFATSGYERVYDGEIYFSSPARMRLAFGPGSAVLILGPARALVVMGSSEFGRWSLGVCRWPRRGWNTTSAEHRKEDPKLVATEKIGPQTRRQHRPIPPRT